MAAGDAQVIFEVLSRSNTKADQAWRRKVYTSAPNWEQYITVAQKTADVVVYSRAADWKPLSIRVLSGALQISGIAVTLLLADIDRYTPLDVH
jgi:hypothetical protein